MMAQQLIKVLSCNVLVTLCGCTFDQPETEPSDPSVDWRALQWSARGGNTFQQEDGAVFETVLTDLLQYEGFHTFGAGTDQLVLDEYTPGDSDHLLHRAIAAGLGGKVRISYKVEGALRDRNKAPVSLGPFKCDNPSIIVRDLSKLQGTYRSTAFRTAYPNAVGFVKTWLPVYSNNGDVALLRFSFGPTAHGAVGTYILMKEDGRWNVMWRSLKYFA